MAWLPRIVLEALRDCLAQLQERTSRVGLRLLRGKVTFFDLLITCQSPRKALETFWMAEVAFLVRGLCGPKEAFHLVPKAQKESGHPTQQGLSWDWNSARCAEPSLLSCIVLFICPYKNRCLKAHGWITVTQRMVRNWDSYLQCPGSPL